MNTQKITRWLPIVGGFAAFAVVPTLILLGFKVPLGRAIAIGVAVPVVGAVVIVASLGNSQRQS